MFKLRTFIVVCVSVLLCTTMLQAGGKKEEAEDGPFEISIASVFFTAEVPNRPDIEERLEDVTGYQLDFNWIPSIGYGDKINAMIASDTLPMMTVVNGNKDAAFVNACRSGMFWELDEYIPQFENLRNNNPDVYNNTRIDGKLYGIYRDRQINRQGIIYREDWLEEEGLEVPRTPEMIVETIRAFSKRSEYGVVLGGKSIIPEGLGYMAIWNGAPNGWGVAEDGSVMPDFFFDEYYEALVTFREMYAEGLINKNFAELTAVEPPTFVDTEQTGFVFAWVSDMVGRYHDLPKINPDAKLMYSLDFTGDDGVPRAIATQGYAGVFAISKTAVKTEEELLKCLDFLNKMGTPEYNDVVIWGIEGVDYVMTDGKADRRDKALADYFNRTGGSFNQINIFQRVDGALDRIETPMHALLNEQQWDPISDKGIHNVIIPYTSQTWTEVGADLDMLEMDATNKYIMGVIDDADWEAMKKNWLEQGGQKVIDEYTAAMNAAK